MGKSYSVDLRLLVLAAIDGGMNKMQAHKTYKVSRSTIDDWLALRAHTGTVAVLPPRVNRRGLHRHEAFGAFIARHQHSTLEQMCVAWQKETQQSVSLMSFSRALRASGYTRKKRVIFTARDERSKGNSSHNK